MRPLFCSPRVGPMVWMNLHLRYLADGVHGRPVVEPMRTWYHQQSWFRASPQSIFLFPPPWMCWKPRARLHTARAHPRQLSCTSPARNPWHFPQWVWAAVSCPTDLLLPELCGRLGVGLHKHCAWDSVINSHALRNVLSQVVTAAVNQQW